MTDLGAFLAELHRLDIRLDLDGDRLRVDAPGSAITAELRAELARRKPELVAHLRGPSAPAEGEAGGEPGPSPGQRRLWALAEAKANGSAYHVPTAFRLKGPLDVSALEAALADLERRHEPLRTTFLDVGGALTSVIGAPGPSSSRSSISARDTPAAERSTKRSGARSATTCARPSISRSTARGAPGS